MHENWTPNHGYGLPLCVWLQVYTFSLNVSTENSSEVYGIYRSDIATAAIKVGRVFCGPSFCQDDWVWWK